MANANKPMGLSPHSYLSGAKWTGQGTVYCIPTSDSTNKYAIGDPVALAGSADAAGIPTVVLATAGASNAFLGPIVGIGKAVYGGAVNGSLGQFDSTVIPAAKATAYYVLVADDPNIIFEVQEGGAGTALAAADVSLLINLLSGADNG